jgi:hypothetical protein
MSKQDLILRCLLIVLFSAWGLIRYARICLCDNCKAPNAIWLRADLQLCGPCAAIYDRYVKPRYRRILFFFRAERKKSAA